jgi:pimeloyl-ACP methyl ester carboxylesterase
MNREGERETINGVEFTHHFATVGGLTWHYVEAGNKKAEPVIFLHGLPESWYSWHYQMEALSTEYRVIALDLKGYGQSDKADGDYSAPAIAQEVLALLDYIGLKRFDLVSHNWGTAVADRIAGKHPHRLLRFVRMEAPLLVQKSDDRPQFRTLKDQEVARQLMSNAAAFVPRPYKNLTKQPIPEKDIERAIKEFSYPGIAEAVPRYFRDINLESWFEGEGLRERIALYAAMDFPVLLLQADNDPNQPQYYFEKAADAFPNAKLQWVENAGHFTELEQPEAVSRAIREFLRTPFAR